MGTEWQRGVQVSYDLPSGSTLIASLTAGQSIMRIRFGWGFYGESSLDTSTQFLASNLTVWGLVTTIGDGSETPPDPRTNPYDADPPTQRWLWWEGRRPVINAIGPGLAIWGDTGPSEPTDAKGQVLATGLGDGQTLNLWASWAAAFDWDTGVTAFVWWSTSLLVKTV
jgi:hypothetical protein